MRCKLVISALEHLHLCGLFFKHLIVFQFSNTASFKEVPHYFQPQSPMVWLPAPLLHVEEYLCMSIGKVCFDFKDRIPGAGVLCSGKVVKGMKNADVDSHTTNEDQMQIWAGV